MSRVLYLASNNRHKQEEFATILSGPFAGRFEVRVARDLDEEIDWNETGSTFEENARIKAEAVRRLTKDPVIADDSGLVVAALGGEPGVHSSRYAGRDGDSVANNAKLVHELTKLAGGDLTKKFPAKFVCVLHYIDEAGNAHVFRGECPGAITLEARGKQGFGYDPLFLVAKPDGSLGDRTMAELAPSEKNAVSHRGRAVAKWLEYLKRDL